MRQMQWLKVLGEELLIVLIIVAIDKILYQKRHLSTRPCPIKLLHLLRS